MVKLVIKILIPISIVLGFAIYTANFAQALTCISCRGTDSTWAEPTTKAECENYLKMAEGTDYKGIKQFGNETYTCEEARPLEEPEAPPGGTKAKGESCNSNADCQTMLVCQTPGHEPPGICVGLGKHGDTCSKNEDCASNICDGGECIGHGECAPCAANESCKSGLCKNGYCQPCTATPTETEEGLEVPKERGIFTRGLSDECLTEGACGTCDILVVVNNIIGFALQIVGGLAVLALVVSGVLYITSGGNPEQAQHAKMAATAAVIGTLIVLCTWLIVTTIVNTLGYNMGSWYAPSC